MSCGKDAEKCTGTAGQNGQPESTATWVSGRGSAGHCDVCGGFLTRAGVCNNPHVFSMSLAGGAILGAVSIDTKGICPTCGAELSVGEGEEDWCIECEDMVTALTSEVVGHIRALGDKKWTVRESAADALGEIGNSAAVPALIERLLDRSKKVRESAVWALGKIGNAKAVPALEKALDDDDSNVRWAAVVVLGKIGDAKSVPALGKVLSDDKNSDVRRVAVKALGEIGDAKAVPALGKALSDDKNSDVRRRAAWALGEIGGAKAIPAIERC